MPETLNRPTLLALEAPRAVSELGLLAAATPLLARAPRGDGHTVLVMPGLGASDVSTRPLRRFLKSRGYDVHGWGLGRNAGPTARRSASSVGAWAGSSPAASLA